MNRKKLLTALVAVLVPAVAQAAAFTNYTGLDGAGWSVDYQLHIANNSSFGGGVPYDTDDSASINATVAAGHYHIGRVAYVMETQQNFTGTGPNPNPVQYVFASFNTINSNAALLGVPSFPSGEIYQENVSNLHVLSGGGATVTNGVFASGGNIEFWPNDYAPQTTGSANPVPGASDGTFDTGDTRSTGGSYGSMQVHNHDASLVGGNQVLLAFNQWNGGGGELGLGNQVGGSGNPDWTFSSNAGSYSIKDLQVLVQLVPEPSSVLLMCLSSFGLVGLALRRRVAKG